MSHILLYEREMQRYIEVIQHIVLYWIKIISWTLMNRFTCIQFYFIINNVSLHLDYFSWKLCLCYMQKTFPSSKTLFCIFQVIYFRFILQHLHLQSTWIYPKKGPESHCEYFVIFACQSWNGRGWWRRNGSGGGGYAINSDRGDLNVIFMF